MDGGGHPGYGSEFIRAAMERPRDGLWFWVLCALVFGIPGVIALSPILLVVTFVAVIGATLTARSRLQRRRQRR